MSIYQGNNKLLGGITNIEENKVKEIIDSERPITTTINSSSTDTEIPSAKSVYDKYNIHDKSEAYSNIITNPLLANALSPNGIYNKDGIVSRDTTENLDTIKLPVDCSWGIREIFWKSPGNLVNKITGVDLNNKPGTWINVLCGDASTYAWSGWQRLCTTTVADVEQTTITTVSSYVTSGSIYYQVKNGVCYVSIIALVIGTDAATNFILCSGLPKCASKPHHIITDGSANVVSGFLGLVYLSVNGELGINLNRAGTGYCSFSYPVAES